MAEKLVPGDPMPMVGLAQLLWKAMRGSEIEMIGLDLRGKFRVGGDAFDGSISGGKDNPWKLYLQESWEYRYLTDSEIDSLRIKKCERIVAMFREKESGTMFQGRILQSGDGTEWRIAEMVAKE
jgi:hypothetical protein